MDKKKILMDVVSDMISNLLYYDRKDDERLPVDAIDAMVRSGEVTVDEIVAEFRSELEKGLKK